HDRSRAELTKDGPVNYLHYGDNHTATAVYLDPSMKDMPRLPAHRAKTLDHLQQGSQVMVDASEELEDVGKAVEIGRGQAGEETVAGLHTIAARFDNTILAGGFKAYVQFCHPFVNTSIASLRGRKVAQRTVRMLRVWKYPFQALESKPPSPMFCTIWAPSSSL
ncbi:MAG: hypothetical protein D6690_05890, partial [Nitrospirae bacterium]